MTSKRRVGRLEAAVRRAPTVTAHEYEAARVRLVEHLLAYVEALSRHASLPAPQPPEQRARDFATLRAWDAQARERQPDAELEGLLQRIVTLQADYDAARGGRS